MDSVQRYTKSFALTRFRARMPDSTSARAEIAHRDLRKAVVEALRPFKKTEVGQALWKALAQQRGKDNFADADADADKKAKRKTGKQQTTAGGDEADYEAESSDTVGWATD